MSLQNDSFKLFPKPLWYMIETATLKELNMSWLGNFCNEEENGLLAIKRRRIILNYWSLKPKVLPEVRKCLLISCVKAINSWTLSPQWSFNFEGCEGIHVDQGFWQAGAHMASDGAFTSTSEVGLTKISTKIWTSQSPPGKLHGKKRSSWVC